MKNKTPNYLQNLLLAIGFSLLSISGFSQTANIVVDGTNVYVSENTKYPFWLANPQTLAAGTNVTSISVIEYNVVASPSGGNVLTFEKVIKVLTTVLTVPAGKTWKVEAALLSPAVGVASNGWTDDGTVVRLTTATDNVGIGTAAPGAKLHINNSVGGTFMRFSADNYAAANHWQWGIESDGLKARDGGGTDRFIIANGGNVGIGTTSPSEKLFVNGKITAPNIDGTGGVQGGNLRLGWGGMWNTLLSLSDLHIRATGTGSKLHIADDAAYNVDLVMGGGNVGIGTTTPNNRLHVDVNSASAGTDALSIANRGVTTIGHTTGLRFQYNTAVPAAIRTPLENVSSGLARLGFYVSTDATAANLTEYMSINSTGNVGIGTTNPASRLHVYDPINTNNDRVIFGEAGTWGTGPSIVQTYTIQNRLAGVYNTGYNNTGTGAVKLWIGNYDNDGSINYPVYVEDENSGVDFFLKSGTVGNNSNSIAYFGGNVGIGTTSPTATLHIGTGSIKFPDGSTQASAPLVQSTFLDLPNGSLTKGAWTVGASHTITGPAVISVHWHALCRQMGLGSATYTSLYVDGVAVSQYGGLRQPGSGAAVNWFDCTNLYMGTVGAGSHTIEMRYLVESNGGLDTHIHHGRLSTMTWKQ